MDHSDISTRREKETPKTKNNMANDCGKRERRGRVENLGEGAVKSREQRKVEKRCEGPTVCATRHEEDR